MLTLCVNEASGRVCWKLCSKDCDAHGDGQALTHALAFELLCRHLPGLAPALRVVWQHVHEDAVNPAINGKLDQLARCCQDHETY